MQVFRDHERQSPQMNKQAHVSRLEFAFPFCPYWDTMNHVFNLVLVTKKGEKAYFLKKEKTKIQSFSYEWK